MPIAWYMDNSLEEPRSDHHLDPPQYVSMEKIFESSGVEHWRIDVDQLEKDVQYADLKKSRGYDYEDLIEISPDKLLGYEEKLKSFYTEHLHSDEEIRLFMDGSGFFDVRDKFDKWIRIRAEKGDLLILPAGIYHRFTPDANNFAKVKRLFCGNPVWKAYDRPADDNPGRIKYLNTISALE